MAFDQGHAAGQFATTVVDIQPGFPHPGLRHFESAYRPPEEGWKEAVEQQVARLPAADDNFVFAPIEAGKDSGRAFLGRDARGLTGIHGSVR